MKILIADDNPDRYARFVQRLEKLGLTRDSIDLVSCADDARNRLEAVSYDLLLLDVLLPMWPDSEADAQHSLDLLFEIHESDDLNRPMHVLGITGDELIWDEKQHEFAKRTWALLKFSNVEDEWLDCATNCVTYILKDDQDRENNPDVSKVDLVIICALAEPELEEVLKLPWNWSASRPIDGLTFVHDGEFVSEGNTYSVCATSAPRMGMVSTALLSAKLIQQLSPKIIVMCGICAGVKGKTNFGDVLLPDPAWDFQSGKRVRDVNNSSFSIAPHQISAPAVLRSHVEQIRSDREMLARLATTFGSNALGTPRVSIGPVASGSAVLADGDVIEEIKGSVAKFSSI